MISVDGYELHWLSQLGLKYYELNMEEVKEVEVNQRTVRFSTAPWYQPKLECTIIGLGGIGSYLSFFLGRQEAELHLYDYDIFEEHNAGGQFVEKSGLGSTKVSYAEMVAREFSDNTNIHMYEKYTKESFSSAYMFCCPDNLEARKVAFENWQEYVLENPDDPAIFIEGSMAAEDFCIHFVTKDKIQQYKEYLYSDIQIPALACNFKSTSHCGSMCAGIMVSGFNNYISNVKLGADIREVPFKVQISLSGFNIEIQ